MSEQLFQTTLKAEPAKIVLGEEVVFSGEAAFLTLPAPLGSRVELVVGENSIASAFLDLSGTWEAPITFNEAGVYEAIAKIYPLPPYPIPDPFSIPLATSNPVTVTVAEEVPQEPQTVKILIRAKPTFTTYSRYHGLSIDESLDRRFWDTQPDKVVCIYRMAWYKYIYVDLLPGNHYLVYGNSDNGAMQWSTMIAVNDSLLAEEVLVDINKPLKVTFNVTQY